MSLRTVLIIGAGKRVQADVLPVLASLAGSYSLGGIWARKRRSLKVAGETYETAPLDELTAAQVAGADLIYLAVAKPAVPAVLRRLNALDVAGIDLLVETPVLLFKHLRHTRTLRRFRNVWVAEDCSRLPWFDVVLGAEGRARLGDLRQAVFDRSAWRYHGLAMLKTLLGCTRITRARRRRTGGSGARIDVHFANGALGRILEPRDYAAGCFCLTGPAGSVVDGPAGPGLTADGGQATGAEPGGAQTLTPMVRDGRCTGFRAGSLTSSLSPEESRLVGAMGAEPPITARMDEWKRVGLYRMLRDIHGGGAGYPLAEALDDMLVDTLLEKAGRYVASPVTSVKSLLGRYLLGVRS